MEAGNWGDKRIELPPKEMVAPVEENLVVKDPTPDEIVSQLSKADRTELERGWKERMQWAAGWLIEKGQVRRLGGRPSQAVKDQLLRAGVNEPERFSEEAGQLLLEWGDQEWTTMVLEVARLQGSGLNGAMLASIEWPNKQKVAESIAGFMLHKLPGWEQAERWKEWRRTGVLSRD